MRDSGIALLVAAPLAASITLGAAASSRAAEAAGTFTSTSTFTSSGTGEFADAEDFCEACDSDGTWDVSVAPTPSAGSIAGQWSLYVAVTDYCPDEDPESNPRELALAPFSVSQVGSQLSADFLGPAVGRVASFFGVSCSTPCPAPGSCTLGCPSIGVSCTATCTPATQDCRDAFTVTGSVVGQSVDVTLWQGLTVSAECPGFGSLTIVDSTTAHLTGSLVAPEPREAGLAACVACAWLVRARLRSRGSS